MPSSKPDNAAETTSDTSADTPARRPRLRVPGTPPAALSKLAAAKFAALTTAAATSSYLLLSDAYAESIRVTVAGIVAASMVLTAQLVRTLRPRVGTATAWAGVFVAWTLATPLLAFAAGSCATLTGTCGIGGFAAWANLGASWAVTLMCVWGFVNLIPSLGKLAHHVTLRITQLSKTREATQPSDADAAKTRSKNTDTTPGKTKASRARSHRPRR